MVNISLIASLAVLAVGIWAYSNLLTTMNTVAEKQLMIEPSKFSYKMWKDMPVTMYQSFTFFNLTNWNQVKSFGQRPRFVEVGPYVYKTVWTKSDIHFHDNERLVNFAERKQWHFQPSLSGGYEDDQIWTINTPLMTALALIQNAPAITRNVVSVVLDGLGEGAFIKRSIRHLLFEGYADLIVSVGPFFDKRFSTFNGKFAYLYNKNDTIDGIWTVKTGVDDLSQLNKVLKFHNNIVNMTANVGGDQRPQGLNELHPNCEGAWTLDQSTNGQLFSPHASILSSPSSSSPNQVEDIQQRSNHPVRYISSSATPPIGGHQQTINGQHEMMHSPSIILRDQATINQRDRIHKADQVTQVQPDTSKSIFYPDLCRPIHLISSRQVLAPGNIRATRYSIDPRVFMNSTQNPHNRCFEIAPKPPLANTLAATLNSVTGSVANLGGNMASGINGVINPYHVPIPQALMSSATHTPPVGSNNGNNQQRYDVHARMASTADLNTANTNNNNNNNSQNRLRDASSNLDPSPQNLNSPLSRLGRVRQAVTNFVAQRISSASSILPGGGNSLFPSPFASLAARNAPDDSSPAVAGSTPSGTFLSGPSNPAPATSGGPLSVLGASDRWVTQFRTKWPRGVFSLSQCQLGAPIYASLPHFLDADDYYREQVDGMRPNRSLHEFYIDVESTLSSIPVAAKARLQLNVATPELRFRNLPNAMIPVLWQEVTFDIDKHVVSMLYWSLTMSPFIYNGLAIILVICGSIATSLSLLRCFTSNAKKRAANSVDASYTNDVEHLNGEGSLSNESNHKRSLSRSSKLSQSVRQQQQPQSIVSNVSSNDNGLPSNSGSQCELVTQNHGITCSGCIKACLAFQNTAFPLDKDKIDLAVLNRISGFMGGKLDKEIELSTHNNNNNSISNNNNNNSTFIEPEHQEST